MRLNNDKIVVAEVRMRLLDSPEKEELFYVLHAIHFQLPAGKARNTLRERLDGVPKFEKNFRWVGSRYYTTYVQYSRSLLVSHWLLRLGDPMGFEWRSAKGRVRVTGANSMFTRGGGNFFRKKSYMP